MGVFLRIAALFAGTLAYPLVALAATPKNFAELAETVVSIVDTGTGALIVLGFVVYFWGVSTNILKFEDDPDKRKSYFFWGLLVLFVMVSIWGIVGLLANTLFGSGAFGVSTAPPPAESEPYDFSNVGNEPINI